MDIVFLQIVVYANLLVVIGLCVLFGMVFFNTVFDLRQRKLFLYAISGNLFVILCVIIDSFCTNGIISDAVILRRFTSFINFGASPMVPILLISVFSNKRRTLIYYIPVFINIAMCLISTGYPLIFYISDYNTYSRGPLFFVPIVTALIYTVLLLVEPSSRHKRSRKQERIFLMIVLLLLGVSMILEIVLGMSFQLWSMTGLCLILYYLLLNVHYFTLDSLAGCYNRIAYSSKVSAIKGKTNCLFTAMDLNGLKILNDTQGHAQGDKLICKFVSLTSEHTNISSELYRVGGDEFMLITTMDKIEKYRLGMEKLLISCEQEGISFAYGEAEYSPKFEIEEIMELADERMYKAKKEMKEKLNVNV